MSADLYDKLTIEECRDIERRFREKSKLPNKQKLTKKEVKVAADIAIHFSIYCYTGERALNKDERIQEWTQWDREKDERLATGGAGSGFIRGRIYI